jgi:hypothetical protein
MGNYVAPSRIDRRSARMAGRYDRIGEYFVASLVVHLTFHPSAVKSLRDAIQQAGRDDSVIRDFDSFNFGPINPPSPALRASWVEEELGYTGWEEVNDKSSSFWSEALSPDTHKIAWMSRRCTQCYAGFLEWLWRIGDQPADLIDLTDVGVEGPNKAAKPFPTLCIGALPADLIFENELVDRARPLTADERKGYRDQWARLRRENAPLRVIENGELASAPMTFFDDLLMSFVTSEWQKTAKPIAFALVDDMSLMQVGDMVRTHPCDG